MICASNFTLCITRWLLSPLSTQRPQCQAHPSFNYILQVAVFVCVCKSSWTTVVARVLQALGVSCMHYILWSPEGRGLVRHLSPVGSPPGRCLKGRRTHSKCHSSRPPCQARLMGLLDQLPAFFSTLGLALLCDRTFLRCYAYPLTQRGSPCQTKLQIPPKSSG